MYLLFATQTLSLSSIIPYKTQYVVCSAYRDNAHQFELKLKKFQSMLEHGIEVTMWQLNRNSDFGSSSSDEFPLKGTQVHIKLQRRGDLLVQAALTFSMKGGYLSKAINRRKGKLTS